MIIIINFETDGIVTAAIRHSSIYSRIVIVIIVIYDTVNEEEEDKGGEKNQDNPAFDALKPHN